MSYKVHTKVSWERTQIEFDEEFRKWGVTDWTTNYPAGARRQGFNQSESDRTVNLTYTKDGKQINLSMGAQARAVDNLRVLYLAVHDMRMNEIRGLSEVLQSAYMQLGTGGPTKRSPYEVLGVTPDQDLDVAEFMFKKLAKQYHPDISGGSAEKFKELNDAIDELRKAKR